MSELKENFVDGYVLDFESKKKSKLQILTENIDEICSRFKEKYGKSPDFIWVSSRDFLLDDFGIIDDKKKSWEYLVVLDVKTISIPPGHVFLGLKSNMSNNKLNIRGE